MTRFCFGIILSFDNVMILSKHLNINNKNKMKCVNDVKKIISEKYNNLNIEIYEYDLAIVLEYIDDNILRKDTIDKLYGNIPSNYYELLKCLKLNDHDPYFFTTIRDNVLIDKYYDYKAGKDSYPYHK